jgi:hypothetical protein
MKRTKYGQNSGFRWASVFILALFLIFISAVAFHHHQEGFTHNDCPLCIAGNHFYMSCQNCSFGNVSLTVADVDLPREPLFYGSAYVTCISLRAPPA